MQLYFLHFSAAIMDFLIILKCSVLFLLIALQKELLPIKYDLCWIYTSNQNKAPKTIKLSFSAILQNLLKSKFWNHFQAEIIHWNPMFFNFLAIFHMFWKNQESCESLLVRFWFSRHFGLVAMFLNFLTVFHMFWKNQ